MKKVLIFSLAYFPRPVGGAEIAIKEITDRIDDVEFHLIANRYDSTLPRVERIGDVLVHRIGFGKREPSAADLRSFPLSLNKPLYQFLAAWKAHCLYRTYRYDAVWGMMAHATGVPAALFKTFHPSVPYLLSLQEGDPPEHIERTMRPLWPLFTRAFRKADELQAISTFLARWGKRKGFRGEPHVIPNGVDVARFSRAVAKDERESVERAVAKKQGEILLITTSRLVHKNAVDDCIRALPQLPASVRLLVLGDGPLKGELSKLAREEGVAERVSFLGHIESKLLPAYLAASDIFIRPSRSEGMGNSFVEAMAAGLPVIATQEGGIADFLFDREKNSENEPTGFAVAPNAPEEIAKQVAFIMEHPDEVQETLENAKKLVTERYDWNIVAKRMREEVFAPLLKGR